MKFANDLLLIRYRLKGGHWAAHPEGATGNAGHVRGRQCAVSPPCERWHENNWFSLQLSVNEDGRGDKAFIVKTAAVPQRSQRRRLYKRTSLGVGFLAGSPTQQGAAAGS